MGRDTFTPPFPRARRFRRVGRFPGPAINSNNLFRAPINANWHREERAPRERRTRKPREFYSCIYIRAGTPAHSPIGRKLRAICAKIKSKCGRRTVDSKRQPAPREERRCLCPSPLPLRSRQQRRADARFEWLIFFLLFARGLPLPPSSTPCDFPSSSRGISFLSAEDETTSALMEDISPLIMINLWDERARTSNPAATGGAGHPGGRKGPGREDVINILSGTALQRHVNVTQVTPSTISPFRVRGSFLSVQSYARPLCAA